MIPLGDGSPRASALVCWALVAANAGVFLLMSAAGPDAFERMTLQYAAVPANVLGGDVAWARVPVWPVGLQTGLAVIPSCEATEAAAIGRSGRMPFFRATSPMIGMTE